ncbi:Flagellar motor switch protein FliN [hydrothermal vent metagenome]|uniref:Flagellar motor switch protein FliN n=1 Tax=hydrothermal vent metagenome TaxID=652676 RepID=A0A3B0RW59_9ZZZZ
MSDMSEAPTQRDIPDNEPAPSNFRLLSEVPVRLSVEVGSISKRLAEILAFQEGEVVELDRQADELLDIMVNGTLVAKGEVVTIDGKFGVRIVELVDANSGFPAFERR